MRSMVTALVFGLIFSVSCSLKEEDTLIKAVRNYRMPGGKTVDEALLSRADSLSQKKGQAAQYTWKHDKLDEKSYKITAAIGIPGASKRGLETYVWKLMKKGAEGPNGGTTWRLNPENKRAKKLMNRR